MKVNTLTMTRTQKTQRTFDLKDENHQITRKQTKPKLFIMDSHDKIGATASTK